MKKAKTQKKNNQLLSFHKYLASFFTKKFNLGPSFGSRYSESPISLLPKLQKLEDWRENQNQASSLQLCQNQRKSKIKK